MKLSEHINALNIEVSSRCTAHCPFCSRQQKKRPYGDHLITLDEFKRLPEDLLRRLRRISFDGNFGDLSCNPEFVDIVAHARELNPAMMIGGHTNGAVRDEAWWRDLGRALGRGYMVFALDGLEDTHGLHRRGTDYHRILKNMAAFIQGGGAAHWQFVVFQHNAHQVEEAEKIARDMGCARFFVLSSRDYDITLKKPAGLDFQIKRDVFASFSQGLPQEDRLARCKPLYKRSIYLAADGTVHPCCLAHCMYVSECNHGFRFILPLIDRHYPLINFKRRPIADILDGPYFKEIMDQARTNEYCVMKCNKHRDRLKDDLILRDRRFSQVKS